MSNTIPSFHEAINEKKKELNKDHRRIIVTGCGASGKDYARKLFEKRNFTYGVSYTTRPPRKGEKEGIDYFFLSEEKFDEMIKNDEFYEYVEFNEWKYGTSNQQFYTNDIFLMTPHGISKLKREDRANSFIIFFDIDEDIRRQRLEERKDADDADRRIKADKKDFRGFKNYDLRITNNDF